MTSDWVSKPALFGLIGCLNRTNRKWHEALRTKGYGGFCGNSILYLVNTAMTVKTLKHTVSKTKTVSFRRNYLLLSSYRKGITYSDSEPIGETGGMS